MTYNPTPETLIDFDSVAQIDFGRDRIMFRAKRDLNAVFVIPGRETSRIKDLMTEQQATRFQNLINRLLKDKGAGSSQTFLPLPMDRYGSNDYLHVSKISKTSMTYTPGNYDEPAAAISITTPDYVDYEPERPMTTHEKMRALGVNREIITAFIVEEIQNSKNQLTECGDWISAVTKAAYAAVDHA